MESPASIPQAGGGNLAYRGGSVRKRPSFSRVIPEQGKKRVNYGKGDARRIMEEAVSLCEAMSLGYEVVLHGRRRSSAIHRSIEASSDGRRRNDPDADLDDSQVAYIARSKRDVAEHFGVAWSTMQPRLVGKIGTKPNTPARTVRMPDDVEMELYNHISWMCDNGYPVTWDGIKEVAWQLGRICHIPGFIASPQWLKRFKSRFPDLEARYSPHLRHRSLKRDPSDPGYGDDTPGDERNASGVGVSWAELGIGGGLSVARSAANDQQATTPGGYLAVQRARAEAEAGALRRQQQQVGVLSGHGGGAATLHHDPRLRMSHGSIMGALPPHLLGHGYSGGQLEMTPHYPALVDSTAVRMPSGWGHGGTDVVMSPQAHDELQQQQQQQFHLNLTLQQLGVAGQHLTNSPSNAGGLCSGHLDGSGTHHNALGTPPVARPQSVSATTHFSSMTGQGVVVGLGNGGHSQQTNASTPGGMVMFPPGGMASARRLMAPNKGTGHAMGMVGSWQAHTPWSEQIVGSWQPAGISQGSGHPSLPPSKQQQQQQQMVAAQGGFQGYHSSTLDPIEAQGGNITPGITPASTQVQAQAGAGRSPFAARNPHDFEVSSDHTTGLGSSLGLGLGLAGQLHAAPEEQPHAMGSAAFGIGRMQGATSAPELRQPKREDGDAANARVRMALRVQEGPAPISGALEGLVGSGGSGGGSSYKGSGDGTSSVVGKANPNSSFPPPSFPAFLPGYGGLAPPGSPRLPLVDGGSYPTRLGLLMRGEEGGDAKSPPATGASMPVVMRNGSYIGEAGRVVNSSLTHHQDSCSPAMYQLLHFAGATPDERARAEDAKARRWTGSERAGETGGSAGAVGRIRD